MADLDMSMSVVENLTEANLKEFSLSRVHLWNNFVHDLQNRENPEELFILIELDELFSDGSDENANFSDGENYEVNDSGDFSENDDTIVNISAIEQNLTVSNAQGVLAAIAQNPNTTGIINEDRKFLKKVLPIFESFNRQIREDGFEKLLNTFNQRKIERHVGKMMPRKIHSDILPHSRRDCCKNRPCDGSGDSFDDCYVCSTRNGCDIRKNYELTRTTIKSYCSVRSRPGKIREKHAYDVPDRTMQETHQNVRQRICTEADACKSSAGLRPCDHHLIDKQRIAHKSYNDAKHHHHFCGDSSNSPNTSFEEYNLLNPKRCCETSKKRALHCFCKHSCSYNYDTTMSNQSRHHSNFQMCHNCAKHEPECVSRRIDILYNRYSRPLADNTAAKNVYFENSRSFEDTQLKNDTKKSEKRLHKQGEQYCKRSKQPRVNEFRFAEDTDEVATTTNSESEEKNDRKSNISRKMPKKDAPVFRAENSTVLRKSSKIHRKGIEQSKNSKSIFKKGKSTFVVDTGESQESDEEDSFERDLKLALKASKELYEEDLKKRQQKQIESSLKDTNRVKNKAVKKNVSFQDKHLEERLKKQTRKHKSDISSESESEENSRKDNNKKESNKKRVQASINRTKAKGLTNREFEENKKVKNDIITASTSRSSKRKQTHTKVENKKRITESKYSENSYSTDSEELFKPKSNEYSDSKINQANKKISINNKTLEPSDLKLYKLHIYDDSSSGSSDANNTIKPSTKNATTVSENTTFFANPGQICNSTALNNPIAKARQFRSTKKHSKHTGCKTIATIAESFDEMPSTSKAAASAYSQAQTLRNELSSSTNSSDCKQVSSTTEAEKSIQVSKPILSKLMKSSSSTHVVLYTPHDITLVPDSSFVNNRYRLTLEHLSSVIGQKYAEVFFRYYRGKRDFNLMSTVKYIPPKHGYYSGNDTSMDDIDPFDAPDIGKIVEEPSKP